MVGGVITGGLHHRGRVTDCGKGLWFAADVSIVRERFEPRGVPMGSRPSGGI